MAWSVRQKRAAVFAGLGLAAAIGLGWAVSRPPALYLTLADDTGAVRFAKPVRPGERFSIKFLHSHAKSPVEEVFEVVGPGDFRLRETLYADFTAGLPHEEGPGQTMEFVDGRVRLSGYDVRFAEVRLRVGRVANHVIAAGGVETRLDSLFRPGGEVKIAVETTIAEGDVHERRG